MINLEAYMEIIATAIAESDFLAYYDSVISIRTNVGWVAAIRLVEIARNIEFAFQFN